MPTAVISAAVITPHESGRGFRAADRAAVRLGPALRFRLLYRRAQSCGRSGTQGIGGGRGRREYLSLGQDRDGEEPSPAGGLRRGKRSAKEGRLHPSESDPGTLVGPAPGSG